MRLVQEGLVDLTSVLIRKIEARTHGQIRDLKVRLADENVILEGRTRTHYAKQLAQHGAIEHVRGKALVNLIQVG